MEIIASVYAVPLPFLPIRGVAKEFRQGGAGPNFPTKAKGLPSGYCS